jgi:hypothetical protein
MAALLVADNKDGMIEAMAFEAEPICVGSTLEMRMRELIVDAKDLVQVLSCSWHWW